MVTVADNGGSSGRLRREFGVLPPGDLRQALSALCGDDDWGRTWARVLQHRFASDGEMDNHAVGNLLIVALWELLGDHVGALDWVGRLLGAQGRVLPMAVTPLDIVAQVRGADPADRDALTTVRGQVQVASTDGQVTAVHLEPADPPACAEAVAAIRDADWVVLGPGSWFTSVIPHLLVPELRRALVGLDGPPGGHAQPGAPGGGDRRVLAGDAPGGAAPSTHRTSGSTWCSPTTARWSTTTSSRRSPGHWEPGSWSPTSPSGTAPRVTTLSSWPMPMRAFSGRHRGRPGLPRPARAGVRRTSGKVDDVAGSDAWR